MGGSDRWTHGTGGLDNSASACYGDPPHLDDGVDRLFAERNEWAGLRSLVCVESERTIDGHTSTGRRFYISDLGGVEARTMLDYVRGHWGIENRLHWSLDVAFREDTLRNRIGHSAENFSRIRRLALNLLKRDKTCRPGIKGKRLQACLKDEYLIRILSQGI